MAFITTQVREVKKFNWKKLKILLWYLNITINLLMTLHKDELEMVKWWIAGLFAVYPDIHNHTRGSMSHGKVELYCKYNKHNLNTNRFTKTEVI